MVKLDEEKHKTKKKVKSNTKVKKKIKIKKGAALYQKESVEVVYVAD